MLAIVYFWALCSSPVIIPEQALNEHPIIMDHLHNQPNKTTLNVERVN